MRTNAKIRRLMMHPESGARSKNMFGIARLFSQDWFNNNSHSGDASVAQPTIRPFDKFRREVVFLKRNFLCNRKKTGVPGAEAVAEWESIIRIATKKCTEMFNAMEGGRSIDVVKMTNENTAIALRCGAAALHIVKTECEKQSACLDMFSSTLTNGGIYCLSMPGHIKIGESGKNVNSRARSQLSTPNVRLEWVMRCNNSRCVQNAVHDLMRKELKMKTITGRNSGDWHEIGNTHVTPLDLMELAKRIIFHTCVGSVNGDTPHHQCGRAGSVPAQRSIF